MKGSALLAASAALHIGLALLFLVALAWWPDYVGRPLNGAVIAITVFLAAYCAFLGFALLKARGGSALWAKIFGIGAGVFVGNLAGFGGWKVGVAFGIPVLIGLAGLWRRKMLANSALDSDSSAPPLRAGDTARQRER
jgi:hypothetical protein